MSIEGKVAIITGATSGVGRTTASVFAARGAKVVAVGRREELGRMLEAEARDAGHDLMYVRADVRRVADCERVARTTCGRYGGVDVLVNAAGVESEVADFHALTEEEWDRVLDTNLKGAAFCCRFAIPSMLGRGGGVILNVASISAVEALAHMAPYNASKAGLVQLTRTLAVEYMLQGIRANVVVLGGAEGETAARTQDAIARYVRGPDFVRSPAPGPLQQILTQRADEVAGVFALLCSGEARLLTGAVIALDRAMTAGLSYSTLVHMVVSERWDIG